MRIAILNWRDRVHPEAGGAELVVHEVSRYWIEWGHDVWLFSSRFKGSRARELIDRLKVVRVGRLRDGSHHLRAASAVHRVAPDVVLESINTIPYQLPLRRGFPPYLPFVHQLAIDVWDAHLPRGLAALARRIEPILYKPYRALEVAANSRSTARDLATVGVRNVDVIPLGGWGPQPLPAKAEHPTVVFAGRLAANKQPDHAIAAFRRLRKELPDAELWIIGEGPMRAKLARELPDGARLLGKLDLAEFRSRLGQAHLLLAPSIREGWGLMVTDANSVGTPAVGYDVPGLRDSIEEGTTGRLSEPEPGSMATVALELLRDTDAYARLRKDAVERASSLTWERTARLLLAKLEKRASQRAASRPSRAT